MMMESSAEDHGRTLWHDSPVLTSPVALR